MKNEIEIQEILDIDEQSPEEKYADMKDAQGVWGVRTYCENQRLLDTHEKIKLLEEKTGITKNTAKLIPIGIDAYMNWHIPIYEYTIGKRLEIGCFHLTKELTIENIVLHTPMTLSAINEYTEKTHNLILVKDHFDGFMLLQYLNTCKCLDRFHIVTSPYGDIYLPNLIETINFKKYRNLYLLLGNYPNNLIANEIAHKWKIFKQISCCTTSFKQYYFDYLLNDLWNPKLSLDF